MSHQHSGPTSLLDGLTACCLLTTFYGNGAGLLAYHIMRRGHTQACPPDLMHHTHASPTLPPGPYKQRQYIGLIPLPHMFLQNCIVSLVTTDLYLKDLVQFFEVFSISCYWQKTTVLTRSRESIYLYLFSTEIRVWKYMVNYSSRGVESFQLITRLRVNVQ